MKIERIAVLGDGGWGTTLVILLHGKGYPVVLWGAFPEYVVEMNRKRENVKFLPGIPIPDDIPISSDEGEAVSGKDLVVLAVPSRWMREVCRRVRAAGPGEDTIYLSAAKGIERGSFKRMTEVISEELDTERVAALSGPSHAEEVSRGLPTTVVVSSRLPGLGEAIQGVFMTDRFRVYTNPDTVGVELGGALKNVIALAAGASEGMGFGDNTKGALLTRGMAEIRRLGAAMGADPRTFSGLSGIGDLITTCISPYGRNRRVGLEIAKGKSIDAILGGMDMVAEGVYTAPQALKLSESAGVEMPITRAVNDILEGKMEPGEAVRRLMGRSAKPEVEDL